MSVIFVALVLERKSTFHTEYDPNNVQSTRVYSFARQEILRTLYRRERCQSDITGDHGKYITLYLSDPE